jgi:hypothetical protein
MPDGCWLDGRPLNVPSQASVAAAFLTLVEFQSVPSGELTVS